MPYNKMIWSCRVEGALQPNNKKAFTLKRRCSMAIPKIGEELAFFDVKGKKKFKSKNWKMVTKKGRRFAVAKAPSGIDAYRILGKA